ncbi:hypothetical protein, variant [Aphanomyces astaci]|uniref:B box-type domain-containing protein n=1 Tax=Aphanomyces astaci TaxID=112090 RepID=W4HAY8_APHAT|nr:hypothetical protein, variant [Aphanomyces astaci]ETV88731.1 hypothetical protein, variant [Aphanomyces astaci]|eukprot:XP_009821131.1 hypothetical protein, variant [Aphanomyces astaci]
MSHPLENDELFDQLYPSRVARWRVQEDDTNVGIPRPTDDLICDECEKRHAVYRCLDCRQTLCHNCTNAMHIIPAYAEHTIRHLQEGDVGFVPLTRTAPPFQLTAPPALASLHIHPFQWSDVVTFRDPVVAPGLLFGIVLETDQPRRGDHNNQLVRVLWIRGVLPLPNATYQAVLTLPHVWPVPIQSYVSLYHAYRAAVVAEHRTRKLWRREKYAGRLRDLRQLVQFPSEPLLREILDDIHANLDSVMDVHMALDGFLSQVSHPPLCVEGDSDAPSEDDSDAPYPPAQRVRVLLLPAESLEPPDSCRRRHLRHVVGHMVDLYIGYGWKALVCNMSEGRRREREALEAASATHIQAWYRHMWRLQLQKRMADGRTSGMDAMEVLRRAQCRRDAVRNIGIIWAKTTRRLQRRGLRRWNSVVDALHEPLPPREAPWHPAWGVRLLKLPRAYAHMKPDGSLAVDDITKYKQFRLNHSGPTASSYWIVRDRILLGTYPSGQAFPDKRGQQRVAARSDAITCMLLEQLGTFVCLLEEAEVRAMEASLPSDELPRLDDPSIMWKVSPTLPPFAFTAMLHLRHAKLRAELEHAVVAAEKYVVMATKTLEQVQQRGPEVEDFVMDLSVKKKALAENNLTQARANLKQLQPLHILHIPIARNQTPTEHDLRRHLQHLEGRLRDGQNLYLFSRDGRGRTGLFGALLLGRLYGLSPIQALERQQRCHDCQRAVAGVPSTRLVSSPEAQTQIHMVHQFLRSMSDTIYANVVTTADEDAYRVVRAQRRGLGVQSYAATMGYMVDAFPTADAMATEHAANVRANHAAKKEIRAMQLRWRRRQQVQEASAMAAVDTDAIARPPLIHHSSESNEDDERMHDHDEEGVVMRVLNEMVQWLDDDSIANDLKTS